MIAGIDEVGRGCWAGPVVAAAVVLSGPIRGLNDSKKLTMHRRIALARVIREQAMSVGVGWVWPPEVDEIGLTEAVRRAMQQAYGGLEVVPTEIIIDGNYNFLSGTPGSRAIVRADGSIACVSAASIVAKVARDEYMTNLAAEYPQYGFDRHVGYGTPAHSIALREYGATPHHRMSYKPMKRFAV